MRHLGVAFALAIGLLPPTVRALAGLCGLVSPPGIADLLFVSTPPACVAAIPLPTITSGADREHGATAWFTTLTRTEDFDVIVQGSGGHLIHHTLGSRRLTEDSRLRRG